MTTLFNFTGNTHAASTTDTPKVEDMLAVMQKFRRDHPPPQKGRHFISKEALDELRKQQEVWRPDPRALPDDTLLGIRVEVTGALPVMVPAPNGGMVPKHYVFVPEL